MDSRDTGPSKKMHAGLHLGDFSLATATIGAYLRGSSPEPQSSWNVDGQGGRTQMVDLAFTVRGALHSG